MVSNFDKATLQRGLPSVQETLAKPCWSELKHHQYKHELIFARPSPDALSVTADMQSKLDMTAVGTLADALLHSNSNTDKHDLYISLYASLKRTETRDILNQQLLPK